MTEEVNGESPQISVFDRLGINLKDVPKDCRGLVLLSDSPSKGMAIQGSINDRVMTRGMLEQVKVSLEGYWAEQDQKAKVVKSQIMNPFRRA